MSDRSSTSLMTMSKNLLSAPAVGQSVGLKHTAVRMTKGSLELCKALALRIYVASQLKTLSLWIFLATLSVVSLLGSLTRR